MERVVPRERQGGERGSLDARGQGMGDGIAQEPQAQRPGHQAGAARDRRRRCRRMPAMTKPTLSHWFTLSPSTRITSS